MRKKMYLLSMLLCVLVASPGGLVSEAGATVLLQTGFDSSEGWVEGEVTEAPNPPAGLGTWSHYGTAYQAAHVDQDPQTFVAPSSGDGLLYVDRVGRMSPDYLFDAAVGGWDDNEGGTTVDVTVDMQVPVGGNGAWVGASLGKRTNDGNDGFQVASVITWSGGIFKYMAGTSGDWITTTAPSPEGQWQSLRLVGNNATKTYSAYIGGVPIIEDVPYRHQSGIAGDDVVRSFGVGLGGPGRGYFDNLVVQGVPEPTTMVLVCFGSLLFARRRRNK